MCERRAQNILMCPFKKHPLTITCKFIHRLRAVPTCSILIRTIMFLTWWTPPVDLLWAAMEMLKITSICISHKLLICTHSTVAIHSRPMSMVSKKTNKSCVDNTWFHGEINVNYSPWKLNQFIKDAYTLEKRSKKRKMKALINGKKKRILK